MPHYKDTDTDLLEAMAIAVHHLSITWNTANHEPRMPDWHDATDEQRDLGRGLVRQIIVGTPARGTEYVQEEIFEMMVRELAKHFGITVDTPAV